MIAHLKFRVVLALAVLLSGSPVAHAETGAIRDNAAFFSTPAKTEALRNIRDIGQRFRKDLVVETFAEIPADLRQGAELSNKAAMARLYEQWAVRQAKQQAVNGIYVLLVKQPAHLQVLVGNDTQKVAFTLADRDALTNLMLAQLRNKQNDQALLEGVRFVQATLRAHLPERGRAPATAIRSTHSSPTHWILAAVLGLVAVWVVMRILGALFAGGGGGGGGYPGGAMAPGGGGGGGFLSNMLGGMFGAAAGMWMYDQFSGRSSQWGGGDAESRGDGGYSGQDTDYSGSGGDFGGGDSGGDSGGGFGGGDSGGGDFGGGGGDF